MSEVDDIEYIWSGEWLVVCERLIWLSVMDYQCKANRGLVTEAEIAKSASVVHHIDLESIRRREMVTKHDIKARLEEFCALSGHERIHLGMTSADIVENTYYIRILESIKALGLLGRVPELPFRGIRGPVGNDVDQLDLLGSEEHVMGLNWLLAKRFGFNGLANAVGQNMPRSYDMMMASALHNLCPSGGRGVVMAGLINILAAQQPWLEGDVSSSVVRRYVWPLLFTQLALARKEQDAQTT